MSKVGEAVCLNNRVCVSPLVGHETDNLYSLNLRYVADVRNFL